MRYMVYWAACWMLVAAPFHEAAGGERTWKSQDGKFQIVAEMIGVEDGIVLLRRAAGKTARVPLQRLSESDRTFVAAQAKAAAAPGPATTAASTADSSGYQYVALLNTEQDIDLEGQTPIHARVPRELVRQALLIAARDGLGLGTRDESIREPLTIAASDKLLTLHIATAIGHDGALKVRVWKGPKVEGEPVWSKDYHFSGQGAQWYPSIIEQVSPDSRGELVELLKRLGCTSIDKLEPTEVKASATYSMDALLLAADVIPQFLAVRGAHFDLQTKGESPESLGFLVRGYANLSLLTTHYWTATSQVFLARSLLYADRLMQVDTDKSRALLHRAYARALTGQLSAALDDLQQAKAGVAELPEWALLIEPYCRCQVEELFKLAQANPTLDRITEWLGFRVATCSRDERLFDMTVRKMMTERRMPMQAFPHFTSALALQRWAAEAGPDLFRSNLSLYLPMSTDLPPAILKDFDWENQESIYQGGAVIVERLRKTPEHTQPIEPSWGMLGSLLQDELFVLTLSELYNATNATQFPLKPWVEMLIPGVADHPYAAYVESFGVSRREEPEEYVRVLDKLQIIDPQPHMVRFVKEMQTVVTPRYGNVADYTQKRMSIEYTFPSMYLRMDYGFPDVEAQRKFAAELESVSPYSALVTRMKMALAEEATDDQLKGWEQQVWNDPAAMEQLGGKYERQQRFDDAKRAYARALETGPTPERCLLLGRLHWRLNEIEQWQATLEGYFKYDNSGLNHAMVHNSLAQGLMSLDRWKDAEPHAVAAAEPFPSWGLVTASQCYEGLKQWQESEEYIRQAADAYGGAYWMDWYLWCQRTGHGDLDQARKAAQQYLKSSRNPGDLQRLGLQGTFDELEGNVPQAIAAYQAAIKLRPSLWFSLPVAMLAKETGDQQALNIALEYVRELSESETKARTRHRMQLAAMAVSVLDPKNGEVVPLTPEQVNKIVDESPNRDTRVDVQYFVGFLLSLQGQKDEARKLWEAAAEQGPFFRPNCTLAAIRSRQLRAQDN